MSFLSLFLLFGVVCEGVVNVCVFVCRLDVQNVGGAIRGFLS